MLWLMSCFHEEQSAAVACNESLNHVVWYSPRFISQGFMFNKYFGFNPVWRISTITLSSHLKSNTLKGQTPWERHHSLHLLLLSVEQKFKATEVNADITCICGLPSAQELLVPIKHNMKWHSKGIYPPQRDAEYWVKGGTWFYPSGFDWIIKSRLWCYWLILLFIVPHSHDRISWKEYCLKKDM